MQVRLDTQRLTRRSATLAGRDNTSQSLNPWSVSGLQVQRSGVRPGCVIRSTTGPVPARILATSEDSTKRETGSGTSRAKGHDGSFNTGDFFWLPTSCLSFAQVAVRVYSQIAVQEVGLSMYTAQARERPSHPGFSASRHAKTSSRRDQRPPNHLQNHTQSSKTCGVWGTGLGVLIRLHPRPRSNMSSPQEPQT
ncbi:hypothetical protein M3J09_006862 [Ascochyta lentis]